MVFQKKLIANILQDNQTKLNEKNKIISNNIENEEKKQYEIENNIIDNEKSKENNANENIEEFKNYNIEGNEKFFKVEDEEINNKIVSEKTNINNHKEVNIPNKKSENNKERKDKIKSRKEKINKEKGNESKDIVITKKESRNEEKKELKEKEKLSKISYLKNKKEEKSKNEKKVEENNNLPEKENSFINPFKTANKETKNKTLNNLSIDLNKKASDNKLHNKNKNSEKMEEILIKKNKSKTNLRKSDKLLFNPKIPKNKTMKPLFGNEELEGQSSSKNINKSFMKEPVFKKTKEIFPSQLGIGMSNKSKINQNYKNTTFNSFRYTLKKQLSKDIKKEENSKNKVEKYEQKTYFSFQSSIKSDNPFKGPSQFEKSNKQRKNQISKTVEKEENEFYDISIIEEKISHQAQLSEEELNQLINRFSNIMYKDHSSNKEELKGYEFKINKITNIIKIMDSNEQKKVMDELKKRAENEKKNDIYDKLKNKIDEFKNKKIKLNKNEDDEEENNDYIFSSKKKFKNSIK